MGRRKRKARDYDWSKHPQSTGQLALMDRTYDRKPLAGAMDDATVFEPRAVEPEVVPAELADVVAYKKVRVAWVADIIVPVDYTMTEDGELAPEEFFSDHLETYLDFEDGEILDEAIRVKDMPW